MRFVDACPGTPGRRVCGEANAHGLFAKKKVHLTLKRETTSLLSPAEEDAFLAGSGNPLVADFQGLSREERADEFGRVAIGKEEANGIAGAEIKGFPVHLNEARPNEFEIRDDAFQAGGGVFDGEARRAVGAFDAEIEQEGKEPFAREFVVIERKHALDARGIIGSGGEIGAEEERIRRAQQRGEPGQDDFRFEVRNHAEKGDEPRGLGMDGRREDFGQILRRGEVADERMAIQRRQRGQDRGAGRQHHCDAHVGGRIGNLLAGLTEQLQQPRVF